MSNLKNKLIDFFNPIRDLREINNIVSNSEGFKDSSTGYFAYNCSKSLIRGGMYGGVIGICHSLFSGDFEDIIIDSVYGMHIDFIINGFIRYTAHSYSELQNIFKDN